ncbi:MAG: radical SAM protein [Candidatus Omnitrophota bacterium]
MRIALIHCPFEHRKFSENLKIVDEEFCLAPPIILAYVAAILEKAGHKVIIIDANALKLTKEETLNILKDFNPHIIGFRADTYWFHRVVEWAGFFKTNMDVKIITGGININLYPKESLSYSCFDYGIIGEANQSLPKLISAIENKLSLKDIKGVIYKDKNTLIINPPSEETINFDEYPFPARHLLPNHLYYSFTSQRKNYTIMLTSTGCPHKCKFCAISKIPYRERSVENILDEIEECYTKYNAREIDFFDATFFINKLRGIKICEGILKRNIKIEWSCRSRIDVVDEDILKKASEAGCKKIYYGIESASTKILDTINKGIDTKKIPLIINLTYKYKIKTLGFFIIGSPEETKKDILNSINFAKKMKLDFIQVCRTIAKPNTDLNELLIKTTGIDYWKEYILNKIDLDKKRLPTPWTTLTQNEIEKLAGRFYREFYFRPSYILKRVINSKSKNEFFRYIKVALRWLFSNKNDT